MKSEGAATLIENMKVKKKPFKNYFKNCDKNLK